MGFSSEYIDAGGGFTAGADFSSSQYRAVVCDNSGRTVSLANASADQPMGILQNAPGSGQPATVVVAGASKFVCGGTVTRGDWLKVDAADPGAVIPGTPGTDNIVGLAYEDGVDGQVIQGMIHLLPVGAA